MQLEQKEDLAQFKLKNAKASIGERQRRGLTWYPITVTRQDIGFGGKVVLELERPAGEQGLHLFQVGKNACLFSNAPGYSDADRPANIRGQTPIKAIQISLLGYQMSL